MHRLFFVLMVVACTQPTQPAVEVQPLKKFYYPLAELREGLVYEYINDSTQLIDYFWFLKTVEDEAGNWFLVSTRYNTNFEQDQISRERVYANGTSCESYQFFFTDSTGLTKTSAGRIKEGVMYPFEIPEQRDLVYRFQMEFNLQQDSSLTYRVTRDRRFAEIDTLTIDGKRYACARFENMQHMAVGDSLHGGHWQMDSSRTTEIYAEGIGLVKTVIRLSTGSTSSHRLNQRYPMEEFMRKYN